LNFTPGQASTHSELTPPTPYSPTTPNLILAASSSSARLGKSNLSRATGSFGATAPPVSGNRVGGDELGGGRGDVSAAGCIDEEEEEAVEEEEEEEEEEEDWNGGAAAQGSDHRRSAARGAPKELGKQGPGGVGVPVSVAAPPPDLLSVSLPALAEEQLRLLQAGGALGLTSLSLPEAAAGGGVCMHSSGGESSSSDSSGSSTSSGSGDAHTAAVSGDGGGMNGASGGGGGGGVGVNMCADVSSTNDSCVDSHSCGGGSSGGSSSSSSSSSRTLCSSTSHSNNGGSTGGGGGCGEKATSSPHSATATMTRDGNFSSGSCSSTNADGRHKHTNSSSSSGAALASKGAAGGCSSSKPPSGIAAGKKGCGVAGALSGFQLLSPKVCVCMCVCVGGGVCMCVCVRMCVSVVWCS